MSVYSAPKRHTRLSIAGAVEQAVAAAASVRDELIATIRALGELYRGAPAGSIVAAQLGDDIRRGLDRLAAVDVAARDELELELLDDRAGDPAVWDAAADEFTWETDDPAGGGDLEMADPADADADEDAPLLDVAEPFTPPADAADATLDLRGWLASVAASFRALGTDAADLVAETVEDLAAAVRATGATTPEQARDRLAVLACN